MPRVVVVPSAFRLVDFDPPRIVELITEVAGGVGLPDGFEVAVEIDEATPFGATNTTISDKTVTLRVEGGAFEDPKRIRQLSEAGTRLVLGRLLYRVRDRLDPAFGAVPPDSDLTFAQHAAWDAYAVGRYARRAGVDGGRQRRRYAFRLRHGFNDAVDAAFDRLWLGENLTWADLEEIVGADGGEQAEVGRAAEQR